MHSRSNVIDDNEKSASHRREALGFNLAAVLAFTVFNGALANVGGGSAAMALDGFFLRAAFTR